MIVVVITVAFAVHSLQSFPEDDDMKSQQSKDAITFD